MASFDISIDAEHGGRWDTLTDPNGRQWLWSHPDEARYRVGPGDAFVDVGGLEECFPTIGGASDHGELWSRRWEILEDSAERVVHRVTVEDIRLDRAVSVHPDCIVAEYSLVAPAGTRFVWAAHCLLDLGVGARIIAEKGPARAWPGHRQLIETSWPRPLGIEYWMLGPDDGTAMFCLLPDRETVEVVDGEDRLRFQLQCPGQPVSVGLWRNLGGFPWDSDEKYRSVGIEPMLGRVFDRDAGGDGDTAVVPDSGTVHWRLRIDNGARSRRGDRTAVRQ
jgi:hypothetical protein